MPRQRPRGYPQPVVVAGLQYGHGDDTGGVASRSPACHVPGPATYRSTIAQRLCPLPRAVQRSPAARPLYDGMLRTWVRCCGPACTRPPALGAGQGSVDGAISVCPQVRDRRPPLVRLVEVEPLDPYVKEVVRDALPGAEQRLELAHVDAVGTMWQGRHSKAPVGFEALEVPPGACCDTRRRAPAVAPGGGGPCVSIVAVPGVGGA